jgi:hypothetical protein
MAGLEPLVEDLIDDLERLGFVGFQEPVAVGRLFDSPRAFVETRATVCSQGKPDLIDLGTACPLSRGQDAFFSGQRGIYEPDAHRGRRAVA